MTELWPDFWTFVQAAGERSRRNWKLLFLFTASASIFWTLISIVLSVTVMFSFLSLQNGVGSNLFNRQTLQTPYVIAIAFVSVFILIVLSALFRLLAILVTGQEHHIDSRRLFKKAIKLFPVYIVNVIFLGFLIVGNFGLLVIPGFILSILLQYVTYEYFIQDEPFHRAVANSMSITSQHWVSLFLYSIPIGLIYLVVNGAFGYVLSTKGVAAPISTVFTVLRFILSQLTTVFLTNYVYELYLEARSRTVPNTRVSLVLPIFTAVIGWLIIIFVIIIPRYESMKKSGTPFNLPFPTPVLSPSPAVRTK